MLGIHRMSICMPNGMIDFCMIQSFRKSGLWLELAFSEPRVKGTALSCCTVLQVLPVYYDSLHGWNSNSRNFMGSGLSLKFQGCFWNLC